MSKELRAKYGQEYPHLTNELIRSYDPMHQYGEFLKAYEIIAFLRLKPGDKILDVGCELNQKGQLFKYVWIKTFGLDFNFSAIEAGRHRYRHNKASKRGLVADAIQIPFADNSFNTVISQDLLEHIPEAQLKPVFDEMVRVNKGNRMFHKITVESDPYIDKDATHQTKWSIQKWTEFFNMQGWEVKGDTSYGINIPILPKLLYRGNFVLKKL